MDYGNVLSATKPGRCNDSPHSGKIINLLQNILLGLPLNFSWNLSPNLLLSLLLNIADPVGEFSRFKENTKYLEKPTRNL